MSIVHLLYHHDTHGDVPLCGRADWESLTALDHLNQCWECASIAGTYQPAEATYRWLVTTIGAGFHPDTRDYDSLPDGITQRVVDTIIQEAIDDGVDVYGVALDLIHSLYPT